MRTGQCEYAESIYVLRAREPLIFDPGILEKAEAFFGWVIVAGGAKTYYPNHKCENEITYKLNGFSRNSYAGITFAFNLLLVYLSF